MPLTLAAFTPLTLAAFRATLAYLRKFLETPPEFRDNGEIPSLLRRKALYARAMTCFKRSCHPFVHLCNVQNMKEIDSTKKPTKSCVRPI